MPEYYCICRSSDGDRFMIECDNCDEWFHGDCISLKQSDAKNIEKYFCKTCVEANPSLKITYKSRKSETNAPKTCKAKPRAKKSSSPSLSASSSLPDKSKPTEKTAQNSSTSGSDTDSIDDDDWDASRSSFKKPRVSIDKEKQNGNIKNGPVIQRDKVKKVAKKKKIAAKKDAVKSKAKPVGTAKNCAKASPNVTALNGVAKTNGAPPIKDWGVHGMPPPLPIPGEAQQRRALDTVLPLMPDIKSLPKIGRKSMNSLSSGYAPPVEETPLDCPGFDRRNLHQCFGPKCRFAAAPNSKYCSSECGRALARKRLMEIMPKRLTQMGNPTYAATLKNQEEMDGIRKRLADCKSVLDGLVVRKIELEERISIGKLVNASLGEEEDEDDSADNSEVSCITCGQAVSLKTAIKHFERCFNRFENQTSYGSIIPTTSTIFCNFFNPKTKTYCRRLKVLCPEHLKEVVDEYEVCGFPLLKDDFQPTSMFCHIYKKSCSKHPSWERIKRAEIDLETLRTWMKMDDLAEQERVLMSAIRSRGGIVQCMTNYTITHQESETVASGLEKDVQNVDICN